MLNHEPDRPIAEIPLQTHLEELRRRCEAIACVQGSATDYWQEVTLFKRYTVERGLVLCFPPPELARPPDDEGNEHQVWFRPVEESYLKVTWPDCYGMLVVYRSDEEAKASPIDYLERMHLHNELFGDSVRFLGVLEQASQLRMVIQQPAIEGIPATLEQINEFFSGFGWRRFLVGGEVAFFDPARQVVVSDTHRGNLILMADGLIAPIDLRVQLLSGALLDAVRKLCDC